MSVHPVDFVRARNGKGVPAEIAVAAVRMIVGSPAQEANLTAEQRDAAFAQAGLTPAARLYRQLTKD